MILTTFVLKRYVVSIICVSSYPDSHGSFSKLWSFEKVLDDGAIAVIESESIRLLLQSLLPFNYEVCSFLGNTYEMTPIFSPCIHKSMIST